MSSNTRAKKSAVKFDDYALFSIVFFLALFAWLSNLQLAIALTLIGNALIFLISSGKGVAWSLKTRPVLITVKVKIWQWLTRSGEVEPKTLYDTFMGYDEITGSPIMLNLQRAQSIVVAGSTGFGKSTWIQEVIDFWIRTHDPADLRLVLCDSKKVSTSPWRHIPHLLLPIAHSEREHALALRFIVSEMERRQALFSVYEDDFCESLNDYTKLSGEHLPRIVVIIDELMDSVKPGTGAYIDLVRLANLARYVGITLLLGTQRPSAKVITGELLNSMVTKVFGYMPNSREYSLVSMIPPEVYSQATATPGRFMLYAVGQWSLMSVKRTSREKMAQSAKKTAGRYPRRRDALPTWNDLDGQHEVALSNTMSTKLEWRGSTEDKAAMVVAWADGLGKVPRVVDIVERYGITKPTAIKIRKLAFPEEYK